MINIGIITVSDRSSRGERSDLSGPEIRKWAESHGYKICMEAIVPDEVGNIQQAITDFSADCDIVLSTGGTGFAPRDVTPEATRSVIDREAPGFAEAMRAASMAITPHAMLSRAVSGIKGQCVIINLPGSPKAVRENLAAIEKALPHAVKLLKGKVADCAEE